MSGLFDCSCPCEQGFVISEETSQTAEEFDAVVACADKTGLTSRNKNANKRIRAMWVPIFINFDCRQVCTLCHIKNVLS